MGNLKSAKRKLNVKNVWIAQETERQKVELVKKIIEERAKTDTEFAKDILRYVGENLPTEVKTAAIQTIAKETEELEKRNKDENEAMSYAYNTCANSNMKLKDISFEASPNIDPA